MNRPDTSADLNRLAMEAVDLPPDGHGHVFADPYPYCLLYGFRVRDAANNGPLRVLLEEFSEQRGAVARGAGAATVGQIAENDWSLVGLNRLVYRLFHRDHVGVKRMPLSPALGLQFFGELAGKVGL